MKSLIKFGIPLIMAALVGNVGAQSHHGYLHTDYGSVWRDSQGQCVWTTYWEKDVPECEPVISKAVESEPVVIPAQQVPAVVDKGLLQFDFDKSDLKPAAMVELDRLVEAVSKFDVNRIEINGHTCSIGTEAYNQGLSERRADSAKSYLTEHGISEDVIESRGYGETQPAYVNDTEEHRSLNRRVEIKLLSDTSQ